MATTVLTCKLKQRGTYSLNPSHIVTTIQINLSSERQGVIMSEAEISDVE